MVGGLPRREELLRCGGELPCGAFRIPLQQADTVQDGGGLRAVHAEQARDATPAEMPSEHRVAHGARAGPRLRAGRCGGAGESDEGAQPRFRIAGLGPERTAANEEGRLLAHLVDPPCLRSAAHSSAVARMAAVMRLQPRLKYLAPKIR